MDIRTDVIQRSANAAAEAPAPVHMTHREGR